jgi:hypothetical protein
LAAKKKKNLPTAGMIPLAAVKSIPSWRPEGFLSAVERVHAQRPRGLLSAIERFDCL